jgi:hypothetical protein
VLRAGFYLTDVRRFTGLGKGIVARIKNVLPCVNINVSMVRIIIYAVDA